MQLVQLVALAFVDVLRIPFVMAVLDIHLANLEVEQDQEDIHLVAQAERQVNMDAGNLDSKSEVLANFYHLKFTKNQLLILMLDFFFFEAFDIQNGNNFYHWFHSNWLVSLILIVVSMVFLLISYSKVLKHWMMFPTEANVVQAGLDAPFSSLVNRFHAVNVYHRCYCGHLAWDSLHFRMHHLQLNLDQTSHHLIAKIEQTIAFSLSFEK